MPARSARPSSCRRPTSSTASTTTATAMSICATACRTCSPPPPTCSRPTAGRPARRYGEGTANFEVMREWNRSRGLPQDDRAVRGSARRAVRGGLRAPACSALILRSTPQPEGRRRASRRRRAAPCFETHAEPVIGPRFARTRWRAPQHEAGRDRAPFRFTLYGVDCDHADHQTHHRSRRRHRGRA